MNNRKSNCTDCGVPLEEGINWRKTCIKRCCSSCLSSSRRQYYLENTQRINELRREHRLNKPELEIYNRIKSKAKRNSIPFDLVLEDIIIPEKCPIFNVPFVFGVKHIHNASLDRIVPSLGYVKGNVVVISVRANSIKNDATPAELRKVADYVDKLLISRYD